MKIAVCHYSFHRTFENKHWSCMDLAKHVKSLGVPGIDFHVRYLSSPEEAPAEVRAALDKTGLELSGISLSNNLNRADPDELKKEIDTTVRWIQMAAELEAPVSRIFGGHIKDRNDAKALTAAFGRVQDALASLAREAEKYGVVLALENHGGLPCSAEEQVDVIRKINSTHLRATIDIGNYMQCGQEGLEGTSIAGQYAAYVHVKDFRKNRSDVNPWGWETESSVVGKGNVDVPACIAALRSEGYDGYLALEYEAAEDEETGVAESIEYLKGAIQK